MQRSDDPDEVVLVESCWVLRFFNAKLVFFWNFEKWNEILWLENNFESLKRYLSSQTSWEQIIFGFKMKFLFKFQKTVIFEQIYLTLIFLQ